MTTTPQRRRPATPPPPRRRPAAAAAVRPVDPGAGPARTWFGERWRVQPWVPGALMWGAVVLLGLIAGKTGLRDREAFTLTVSPWYVAAAAAGAVALVALFRSRSWIFGAGGVIITGALFGIGYSATMWHLSASWALTGGVISTVVLAVGGWAITGDPDFRGDVRAWFVGYGLIAGAYLTTVASTDPFALPAWIASASLTTVGTATFVRARHAQLRHERAIRTAAYLARHIPTQAAAADPGKSPDALRWEALAEKAGAAGLTFLGRHATEAGPMIHYRLPDDMSITFSVLNSAAWRERFAGVYGHTLTDSLRPNAIRVQRAKHPKTGQAIATEVFVIIDVRDILAEIVPLVVDNGPISVYDAFPIGKFADGQTLCLTIAEIHLLIVGATRQGKSNLLHVILFVLTRCYDAVTWMYDGKGGAVVRKWLNPWLNHEINPITGQPLEHPLIDWPAIDRFEFERMLLAGIAAAEGRPGIRAMWPGGGGSKWTATREHPVIFIICDEIARSTGTHTGPAFDSPEGGATSATLTKYLTTLLTIGAGEGVLVILAAQRSTVTMLGNGDSKANLCGRLCFPMTSTGDAADVFQKDPLATQLVTELEHPGCVVVDGFPGLGDPAAAKVYFVGKEDEIDEVIRRAVIARSSVSKADPDPIVPALDDATAELIAQYGYEDRWSDPTRTWWMRGKVTPPANLRRWNATAPTQPATVTTGTGTAVLERPPASSPFTAAFNEVEGITTPPAADPARPLADPDEDAQWREIEARYGADMRAAAAEQLATGTYTPPPAEPTEPAPTGGGDPTTAYGWFVKVVRDAGPSGITAMEAWQAMPDAVRPKDRTSVYKYRDQAAANGDIKVPTGIGTGARNARFYGPQHWT